MTENVLASVKATGGVKSFVLTSSRAAAFNLDRNNPKTYTDQDWFNEAAAIAEHVQDPTAKGAIVYAASKVAGEKAVWGWTKKEKVSDRKFFFDLLTFESDRTFLALFVPRPFSLSLRSEVSKSRS